MPVMASAPDSEVSRLMAVGLAELLPADLRARIDQTSPRRGGLFGRLFKR
jgi:hypothetical protein